MLRGSPFICIRQAATPPAATASSAPGARNALTSLIMAAPALIASRITSGFDVSTETDMFLLTSDCTIGIIRLNSSSMLTGSLPGRVDSPPMSSQSAPSLTRRDACRSAPSVEAHKPPSEKESGVTFTIPITSGRGKGRVLNCCGEDTTGELSEHYILAGNRNKKKGGKTRLFIFTENRNPPSSNTCLKLPRLASLPGRALREAHYL